jgi:hypothetical protein
MLFDPNGPKTLEEVTNDAVCANEALVEPLAKDALKILFTPNGPLTLEDVTKEAVEANEALVEPLAKDALRILFDPKGPKTLDDVTKDAVVDVPSKDPVKLDADIDPNISTLPVRDVLPDTISDPVII